MVRNEVNNHWDKWGLNPWTSLPLPGPIDIISQIMPKGPEIFDECWDTEILQSEEKKKYYVCMLKKMKLLGLANELNKLRLYEGSIKDKSLPIPLYGETIGKNIIINSALGEMDYLSTVAHEVGHAILQGGIDDLLNKLFEHFLPDMELSNEVWVENYVKKYYKEANEEIVKRITCCKNGQKRTINITRFDIIKASCGGPSADCKGKGF